MTLIALGFTIAGFLKKKQKLWTISLGAFVLFTLLSVFSVYAYVKASIDYMGSDEFQSETRKKAENMGKTWGNTVSGTADGVESTLDEEAISKLAEKGGLILGKGIQSISSGLDQSIGKTTVFADQSIESAGIEIGRSEQILDSSKYSYGLFLAFKEQFEGTLVLTAYDSKGLKQDISEITLSEKAGKAKVYVFQFDYFKPGKSGYCILTKQN